MTGHGAGVAQLGGGRVRVELRAVNHRGLELRARLPQALAEHTAALEAHLREQLERGRVSVSVELERGSLPPLRLDEERAEAALTQLRALRDRLAPGDALPLSLLSSVPDLFVAGSSLPRDQALAALKAAADLACGELFAMQDREGAALLEDLMARRAQLLALTDEVESLYAGSIERYQVKLQERVSKLLEGQGAELDPSRLAQEVALLADRADVAEELTRMRAHLAHFAELALDAGARQGKRLDFLLQEMVREANTTGSKSADATIAAKVVQMKTEISRMREQVQNVL